MQKYSLRSVFRSLQVVFFTFFFTVALFIGTTTSFAQGSSTTESVKGVALIIGNAAYTKTAPLVNPVNDAEDVGATLKSLGWDVLVYKNATYATMKQAVREFASKLRGKKAGFFYYAGHGIQVEGVNYLVPVDADIKLQAETQSSSMDLDFVLRTMEEMSVPIKIVVLDACRDNPFQTARGGSSRGLAVLGKTPTGTVIVYATAPNDTSADGSGRNGVFTAALLPNLATPGLEFREIFDRTGEQVATVTKGRQNPWINSSYYGKLYLVSPDEAGKLAGNKLEAVNAELSQLASEQARLSTAILQAKDQAEKDRLSQQARVATAQEAIKREEVAALEKAKLLAITRAQEEERNRQSALARAKDAEQQLAVLRKQTEERRVVMSAETAQAEDISSYFKRIKNYKRAVAEIQTRFNSSLDIRLVDLSSALDLRLTEIGSYAKDPWESSQEFEARKESAKALSRRDWEREIAGLRASYDLSIRRESSGIETELAAFEIAVAKKTWVVAPMKIKLKRGIFDDVNKTWTISVECDDPIFKDSFTVAIPYRTTDELRTKYLALDAAWQAGAIEARITTALRKNQAGEWEGYFVGATINDGSSKGAVLASRTNYTITFIPSSPYSIPGRLVLLKPPIIGTVSVGSKTIDMGGSRIEKLEFNDVKSLEDVQLAWHDYTPGITLSTAPETLLLEPGELRILAVPTGTLEIPALPEGIGLYIGEKEGSLIPLRPEDRVDGIFPLLPGNYHVKIAGLVSFDAKVTIKNGTSSTIPDYQESAIAQLTEQYEHSKRSIASSKSKRLFSLISAGTGLVGFVLSGVAYGQGSLAYTSYESASTSDELLAARSSVDAWSTVFIASASTGGLSIAASAILWPWKSNMAMLEADMRQAEAALQSFKR